MDLPQIHDRFDILERLEDNETQQLYRAADKLLERQVLLKLPGKGMVKQLGSAVDQKRSLREARMLAKVSHSGIAQLLDIIELPPSPELEQAIGIPGGPLLVLEAVSGEGLADRIAQQPMSADEVRQLGRSLCDALSAVHEVGVVHRGISAESVVLRADGSPCLGGFSFAKQASMVGGSSICYRPKEGVREKSIALPTYPAPEQLSGQIADARSDLYGLGSLMYRCLAGEDSNDIGGSGDIATILGKLAPEAPAALIACIAKAMARSPMGRYTTAREMAEALDASVSVAAGKSGNRMPMYIGIGSAAAALALSMVLWFGQDAMGRVEGPRGRPIPQPIDEDSYSDTYAETYALLIGIGEAYDGTTWTKLNNPALDVQGVKKALTEDLGWPVDNITLLPESKADRKGIFQALEELVDVAGRNDRILVYFAGHGSVADTNPSDGWLVPAGATKKVDYIQFHELQAFMNTCLAKHILLTLDCCFAGRAFDELVATRGRAASNVGLSRRSHLVLASTGDRVASDGKKGEMSPFAAAFVKALHDESKDRSGDYINLDVSSVLSSIQDDFGDRGLARAQMPDLRKSKKDQIGGRYLFSVKQK